MTSDDKIWIGQKGEKFGPYSEATIRQWLSDGTLASENLAWRTGMATWSTLSDMFPRSLNDEIPPPPPVWASDSSSAPFANTALPPAVSQSYVAPKQQAADYGLFLLAIPAAASLLIWVWVSSMTLLQSPDSTMSFIMFATVFGTAILAAMEAGKNGMTSDRQKGTYGPTAWFFILLLFWIIGYPIYLYKRKYYGLANRLTAGLVVALIFVISATLMNMSIAEARNKLLGNASTIHLLRETLVNHPASSPVAHYWASWQGEVLLSPVLKMGLPESGRS